MEKKKIITLFLLTIVCSQAGLIFAGYILGISTSVTGHVVSDFDSNTLVIQTDFSDYTINTTDSPQTFTQNLSVMNNDGVINASVFLNNSIELIDQTCNNVGDVTFGIYYQGNELHNGDYILLDSGISNFELRVTAQELSCRQNLLSELILSKV